MRHNQHPSVAPQTNHYNRAYALPTLLVTNKGTTDDSTRDTIEGQSIHTAEAMVLGKCEELRKRLKQERTLLEYITQGMPDEVEDSEVCL